MSLWDRIMSWLGTSPEQAGPGAAYEDGGGVAVAVAPGDDARDDAIEAAAEEAPWWAPEGVRTIVDPRMYRSVPPAEQQTYAALTAVVESPTLELPRLPQVAQRALMMLREESVNYQKLSEVVQRDPALSAEVLRTANSALYRGVRDILQLDHAFSRLGTRAIRTIILTANMKQLAIRTGGAAKSLGEELWQRSVASGIVLGRLAERFNLPEDELFLVGLLHDIGMFALLRTVHEYERTSGTEVSRATFDMLCDQWHEPIGRRLATEWNLPDPLPELVGQHHVEPAADDPLRLQRLLIGVSDAVCALLNYSPYVAYDFFALPGVQAAGFTDDAETLEMLADLPEYVAERMILT